MPDAGCAAVSVIENLQQVAPLLSSERRDAPIVGDLRATGLGILAAGIVCGDERTPRPGTVPNAN
jgi:hypothetical protein